ncbi:MAG: tagaturonate epimerase family protein [Phycisphaerae bacterium]
MIIDLERLTNLSIYPASVSEGNGITYFLGRRGAGEAGKFVGSVGEGGLVGEIMAKVDGQPIIVAPANHVNAMVIRNVLPWTAPVCLGLATSAGLGDRLGLATPGHIRAMRSSGQGLRPILAQQSIREMTRTQRTPEEVMDCATWGVLQEGWREGFGSDADHLQQPEGIDSTVAAGFTMFTIDPGQHVNNAADTMDGPSLLAECEKLDFDTLSITIDHLRGEYLGKTFPLADGGKIEFDEARLLRAAVKYGNAVAHTAKMYRHLAKARQRPFELEVSVDETQSPTTPAEHFFFASELVRLGVKWVSMAPRFIGRFEKGVDYIGPLAAFRKSFKEHVAVMRTLGPYKMSIHSGSDKFSIYPIVAELTEGLVHLKTAGTSYLEALRAVAKIDPKLFRDILDFARAHYETDKASYHVSADLRKVKPASSLTDAKLAAVLEDFHARQALHVTFGSVLTEGGGARFRKRLLAALAASEEVYYGVLEKHLGRHLAPFAR